MQEPMPPVLPRSGEPRRHRTLDGARVFSASEHQGGRGREAFVYFNNDTAGHALYDAADLAELMGAPLALKLR